MALSELAGTGPLPWEGVLPYLAPPVRQVLARAPRHLALAAEEVRLRAGRPLMLTLADGDAMLRPDGQPTDHPAQAYRPDEQDLRHTLQAMGQWSVYALEDELRQGFLTLPGGHRVGLAGRVLTEEGRPRGLRDIASLSIRLARALPRAADPVLAYLAGEDGFLLPTLVLSPPGAGKTTLLRALVARAADGVPGRLRPHRVALVDERSEVAGCCRGTPGLYVGMRTDVLDGCPKAEGIRMAVRALGPQVVATDEVGRPEDAAVLEDAVRAGVRLLATAHASSAEEARQRDGLAQLLAGGAIARLVVLSRRRGPGTVEGVYDGEGRLLAAPSGR